jgi:hypothetical protein
MGQNKVTVFSNGIADFQWSYQVKKGRATAISIPVKKDHIGDVLASLNVFGNVSLACPASFRPANELEGNLSISSERAIEDLVTTLGGAKIEIEKAGEVVPGTLVGLHTEQEATGGEPVHRKHLVVLDERGLRKIAIREIQALRFQDKAVRTEIDRALQRNFQKIKPNSTFVDLALSTEEHEAETIVQYAIPAAAWKISYRLRQDGDNRFEFQGFAVVDNNTDEDWNDVLIAVVTGEPITFSTDLADSKTPRRSHVDVVRDSALGAVEVEKAFAAGGAAFDAELAMAAAEGEPDRIAHRRAMHKVSAPREASARAAATQAAEVREVGDFCVFESKSPVTIAANRSAVIPVFAETLEGAKTVLHYKLENHPERPYRAVQCANQTPYSLGRGVCTVYEAGTYAGSCILPATKPDADCLLPHAMETGVRLRHDKKQPQRKAVGLLLSEGYCYTSYRETQRTVYQVKNNADEHFELILDHDKYIPDADVECTITRPEGGGAAVEVTESLKSGFRVTIPVAPQEELALNVVESRLQKSRVQLVNISAKQETIQTQWLEENLVLSNGPLANDPAIGKCLEIQRSLDAKRGEIKDAVMETERLASRQERLRKNIATGGHGDQTNQWKTDLGEAENKIVEFEESLIPRLRQEEKRIKEDLAQAMMALAAEWKAV